MNSYTNKRHSISRNEWKAYWKEFYRNVERVYEAEINRLLEKNSTKPMTEGGKKYVRENATRYVRILHHEEHGIATKHISKRLTEKALAVFTNYFVQLAS